MTAKLSPDTTHRRCAQCGLSKLLEAFPLCAGKALGRHYCCRECRKKYDRNRPRKGTPRGPKPNMGPAVVLPAMDLMERLACRRLARWAKCVETNPRFGVAMIGGGYV